MKLAELCKVSPSYIGEIEIGRKFPSANTLQIIADKLNLKPYQLFLEKEDIEVFNKYDLIVRFYNTIKDKVDSDLEDIFKEYMGLIVTNR